jgi:hypothetical protein
MAAVVKHAIASARLMTISSDARWNDPPDLAWNVWLIPRLPAAGGVTLTLGRTVVFFLTGAFFLGFGLLCTRSFGFVTAGRVDRAGATGGWYEGVGETWRGAGAGFEAGFGAGFGFGFGLGAGAGSGVGKVGVGTVGVGTVVGGGSSARAFDGRTRPKVSPAATASTIAPMANMHATRDKLPSSPVKDSTQLYGF